MLTLITYPAQFGDLSASPFCVKAIYLLNASGLAWQREDTNDPRKMPQAKLPVLRTETGLIHGSDNIAAYLCAHGPDLDAALSPKDRAVSHALIRIAEEHLYFIQALDRWEREDVWPVVRDTYFVDIPPFLRGFITGGLRRTLLKGMKSQGLGRMPWSERMARADADFRSISAQLDDKAFLFSDVPTTADASVASVLMGIKTTPVETELSRRVAEDPILAPYAERVRAAWGDPA